MERRLSRRMFSNLLVGGGLLIWLGTILQAIFRYVIPPASGQVGSLSVLAAKTTELPPNSGKIVRYGSSPAIIVRPPGGEVRAFLAICTHLACTVQYRDDLAHIWCACHNGHFDLFGRNVSGPPPRPLEELQVVTRGNEFFISKRA
ncbi:MAG: Rieske (2Fe-2S) protein [Candidatus Tectomicrobia bacterium]|nr:Rieske (2Fe-2S) protein [Candidatus Tectomicrobia bacterium]